MRVGLLGPTVLLTADGGMRDRPTGKAVLALLAMSGGRSVSADRLAGAYGRSSDHARG